MMSVCLSHVLKAPPLISFVWNTADRVWKRSAVRKLTDDRLLLTGHAVQAQDEWHKGLQRQASRWATVAESHEVLHAIAHLYTCRQRHTLWQLTQQTLISWAVFLNIPVAIIAFCSSPRERTPFFVISARLKSSCQDTFEKEKDNVIINTTLLKSFNTFKPQWEDHLTYFVGDDSVPQSKELTAIQTACDRELKGLWVKKVCEAM